MEFDFSTFNTSNLLSLIALCVSGLSLFLVLLDRLQRRKRIRILDPLVFYLTLDEEAGLCMNLTLENYSSVPVSVSHARISLDRIHWFDFALCPPIQDDKRLDPILRLSPSGHVTELPTILPPYSAQRMSLWFHDRPSHELFDRFLRVFPHLRSPSTEYKFYSSQKAKGESRLPALLSFDSCGKRIHTRLVIRDRNIVE